MMIGDHYGFIFGTGAIYGFISEYNKREVRNAAWAAEVLLKACSQVAAGTPTPVAQRWEGRVTFDDGDAFPERDYLGIAAGTVDQMGLGFRPFYRFAEEPDRFHMLGIHTALPASCASCPKCGAGARRGRTTPTRSWRGGRCWRRAAASSATSATATCYDHPGPLVVEGGAAGADLVEPTTPFDVAARFLPS